MDDDNIYIKIFNVFNSELNEFYLLKSFLFFIF